MEIADNSKSASVTVTTTEMVAPKATVVAMIGDPVSVTLVEETEMKSKGKSEADDTESQIGRLQLSDAEIQAYGRAEAKAREASADAAANSKQQISMVVIGHVDAGKSTLISRCSAARPT